MTFRSSSFRGFSLRPRSGFSLIEVIIAIGIVVAALAAAAALVHTVPLSRTTHDEDLALVIARGELESVRAGGYDAVPASGAFSNPLLTLLPSSAGTLTVSDWNAGTKQVTVTVSWQEPALSARSIVLSTLVTKVGGLP